MKKLILLTSLLITIISSCAIPDKNQTVVNINKEQIKWDNSNKIIFEDDRIIISMILNESSDEFIKGIIEKISIDNEDSGKNYIINNYVFSYVEIRNKTDHSLNFKLDKLKIISDDVFIKAISPLELPNEIVRTNPKGITKNVYNGIWISTLSIVGIGLSIGGGELIARIIFGTINAIRNALLNDNFDFKTGKISHFFSKNKHLTKYNYNDLIFGTNYITAKSEKRGIVVFKKFDLKKKIKIKVDN